MKCFFFCLFCCFEWNSPKNSAHHEPGNEALYARKNGGDRWQDKRGALSVDVVSVSRSNCFGHFPLRQLTAIQETGFSAERDM